LESKIIFNANQRNPQPRTFSGYAPVYNGVYSLHSVRGWAQAAGSREKINQKGTLFNMHTLFAIS